MDLPPRVPDRKTTASIMATVPSLPHPDINDGTLHQTQVKICDRSWDACAAIVSCLVIGMGTVHECKIVETGSSRRDDADVLVYYCVAEITYESSAAPAPPLAPTPAGCALLPL